MKIQHIKIGKHYEHVINYEQHDFVENYILSNEELNNNNNELLRITPDFFNIVTGFEDRDVKQYFIKKINVDVKTDVVNLKIVLTNKNDEDLFSKVADPKKISTNNYVCFDKDNNGTFIINKKRGESKITTFRVCFQLDKEESFNEHYIQIIVAPNKQIYDVMLDYGSEATQMYIARRDEVLKEENYVHLFPTMSNVKDEDKYKEYIQYDNDTDKFYKSKIYIKRKISKQINSIDSYQQQLLPLLTKNAAEKKAKNDEIMLLPNQKLYNWGGIQFEQIKYLKRDIHPHAIGGSNSLLYKSCLAYFVKIAIDQVNNKVGSDKAVLSLHLMMPNVYSEENVSEKIHNMYDVLNDILSKSNNNSNKIVDYEVTAVSESDASLFGASASSAASSAGAHQVVNVKKGNFNDGFYLVIDAGKGTLDMSLLNISDGSIATYWRDCIIGSGNYISYLILLDVLASMGMEEKKISNFIRDMVLSHDEYSKEQLMTHIETIKKKYSEIKTKSIWRSLKSNKLQDVVNDVDLMITAKITAEENNELHQLSTKYLEAGIEQYVKEEFAPKIKQMHRILREQGGEKLYLVFSGRASRFEIFKDALYNTIVDEVCNLFIDETKYLSWINNISRQIRKKFNWWLPELKTYTRNDSAVQQKNVCLMSLSIVRQGKVHRKMLLDRERLQNVNISQVSSNEMNLNVEGKINTTEPKYLQRG